MNFDSFQEIVKYCPVLLSKSLDEFLGSMLSEDLDVLAQMPGTPGQVLAAQFTHYVRSSVLLTECVRRDDKQAMTLRGLTERLAAAAPPCGLEKEPGR